VVFDVHAVLVSNLERVAALDKIAHFLYFQKVGAGAPRFILLVVISL
jgi:hypothetical protein